LAGAWWPTFTGTVNQELLVRNEYLGAENRILRGQIKARLLLSEGEKARLAEIAQRLGRKASEKLAAVAKPDILLAWYRKLIANKFDGSKFRQRVGRLTVLLPRQSAVVQMAKENPSWGYDRIVGALANLSFLLSDQRWATFSIGMASLLRRRENKQYRCHPPWLGKHHRLLRKPIDASLATTHRRKPVPTENPIARDR
jgi:hypothetical protein